MLRFLGLAFALLALAPSPAAAGEELLPRPPELEPNVRFWTRIYTEIDRRGGLIHDAEDLDVIYEVVRFPEGLSSRAREQQVERAKRRLRDSLLALASGRRSGLSADQSHVLSRWPEASSNETLRRAAGNVRFQLGQADKFRAGLIRQGAWKDHIEKTLEEHGVPRNLVALPHVESSYDSKAYSRVGAAGIWQFTRSTGRRYLRVDGVVDERLDPFKATVAAARLLADNYRRTQAWPLAITAYNHGAGGMNHAVRKLGTRDIAAIARRYRSRSFGFASRNFYCEFLAADEVDRNAERYFGPLSPERPVDYEIVELPHFYEVSSLERVLGIGRETLHEHNYALRPAVWKGTKRVPQGYPLRLPRRELSEPPLLSLARIPASERLEQQHRDRLYKVQRGDSLSRIARSYGIDERQLMEINSLRDRHRIRVGQVLTLPDRQRGEEVYAAAAAVVAAAEPPEDGLHTVRRGETLSSIARRFGLRESQLLAWNDLRDRHHLAVGQRLRVTPSPEPVVLAAAPLEPVAPAVAVPAPGSEAAAPGADGAAAAEALPQILPEGPLQGPREPTLADGLSPESLESLAGEAAPQPEAAGPLASAEPAADTAADAAAPVPPAGELVAALDAVAGRDALEGDAAGALDGAELAEALEEQGEVDTEAEAKALLAESPPAEARGAGGALEVVPDPSDYSVHSDHSITVQADETLGHYAEWLGVPTRRLRQLNRMRAGSAVIIGRHARLDFSRVPPEVFERRRLEYHQSLQEEFFGSYQVTGTVTHELRKGETLWELAMERYKLPVWLLRQYNPEVDFGALAPGTQMVVPTVEPRQG